MIKTLISVLLLLAATSVNAQNLPKMETGGGPMPEGQWIYLFDYDGQRLKGTRLVNMKNHDYKLEPNIHFSPDQRWIIFRANFEGTENVYGVEIAK